MNGRTPRVQGPLSPRGQGLSPVDLASAVLDHLASAASLSPGSTERLSGLMNRFARYVELGLGIEQVEDVSASDVSAFVHSRTSGGGEPSVATMHLRRSAVRLLYRTARQEGLSTSDPAADLELPSRSSLRMRPLADDEVELCRAYSARTLKETRQPAAWALAEATARSSELARVRIRDVDLDGCRVWIPGSSGTDARLGELSEWGRLQIERRVRTLRRSDADALLVCTKAAAGESAASSGSIAIAATLRRAGLHSEPDVRPSSVAAWAGARKLLAGVPIDQMALMLGFRSLDRAAAFVGFEWAGERRGSLDR
ncbi:MAG: site-specific integrase [Actinomycetota bacterium]|nr:site-specific integrase [Actinomycetota bacterium]